LSLRETGTFKGGFSRKREKREQLQKKKKGFARRHEGKAPSFGTPYTKSLTSNPPGNSSEKGKRDISKRGERVHWKKGERGKKKKRWKRK